LVRWIVEQWFQIYLDLFVNVVELFSQDPSLLPLFGCKFFIDNLLTCDLGFVLTTSNWYFSPVKRGRPICEMSNQSLDDPLIWNDTLAPGTQSL